MYIESYFIYVIIHIDVLFGEFQIKKNTKNINMHVSQYAKMIEELKAEILSLHGTIAELKETPADAAPQTDPVREKIVESFVDLSQKKIEVIIINMILLVNLINNN